MNTGIAGKDLMKHYYLIKKIFTGGITNADYMHGKRVKIDFKIKNLGEYHDLYVHTVIHYYLQVYLKTSETNVLK